RSASAGVFLLTTKPPADAELKIVLGSAGASPPHYLTHLPRGSILDTE
ncbi:MAG: hypothetical protein JWN70_6952, partial [Planctomycetaceae bacterium]|nr:hypothetical protein [Planctomycetaceae bacterium]